MSKRIEKDGKSVKRLRPEQIEAVIISTVFEELLENGFRAVTIESISAKTGIAKTSIYRRWPNKAAMVMEAFLFRIGPGIEFPRKPSYVESIRLQMLALAKAFRGPFGSMIKALLGEAQFDAELAEAFRTRWIAPRREAAKEVIQSAIKNKELRPALRRLCARNIFRCTGRFAGSGGLEVLRSFPLHSYLKKDRYLR